MQLHQYEKLALRALAAGACSPEAVARHSGLPPDGGGRALAWLEGKGLAKGEQSKTISDSVTQEGTEYLQVGFPEERVLAKAAAGQPISVLSDEEKKVGLAWAKRNDWIGITAGRLALSPKGKLVYAARPIPAAQELEAVRQNAGANGPVPVADSDLRRQLLERRLAVRNEIISTVFTLTAGGVREAKKLPDLIPEEVNRLTKELIVSGDWRKKQLRAYDVSAPAEDEFPGKRHPLARLVNRVRDIFSEMGFEEMDGGVVESAFWNFDALFQPQDHPARELADTFYLEGQADLPEDQLVEAVKAAHEAGWKYEWKESEAKKRVLRAHTTVVSARYLHGKARDKLPKKFFCVGRVYRNEATDYKHLAEFHQVEGIVVWENATFRDLLGFLQEFYKKLGFKKVRFRPSFFPYTEPSLEVEVFFEDRKQWMELGGAGIFRPEVSIPLCGRYPVLAWGLSLERPLMLLNGIEDIRTFYRNDLKWLRETPIADPRQDTGVEPTGSASAAVSSGAAPKKRGRKKAGVPASENPVAGGAAASIGVLPPAQKKRGRKKKTAESE